MQRKFDKEFKINAVRLVVKQGVPVSKASQDLGIGLSTLERWVGEMK